MKLTSIFPQIKTDNKIEAKRSSGVASSKAADGGTLLGADRVQLSTGTQDVQKAQEILQQTPVVRAERVESLRQQIERGDYRVDAYKVADKMLFSLVSDNIVSE